MWGMTLLASLIIVAALCSTTEAFARNKAAAAPAFVTTAWANLRQGPGTSWPLLAVIPPSTGVRVNFCSTKWSIGWCQATYEGQTGSVRSSLLKVLGPTREAHPQRGYSEPAFLVQAERNYRRALHASEVQKSKLKRLRQEEARLSRIAMSSTGQWIEPTALWRRKLAEKQNLAWLRKAAAQARAKLDNAENQARSISNAESSRTHARRWPSWRQWW